MRFTQYAALAAAASLVSVSAQAAVTFITGAGSPATAVPGTLIDFESVLPGTYTTLTVNGVTFTPAVGTNEFVDSSYAGNYNNQGQSLQNTYDPTAFAVLNITFATPVSAFAFNFGASDTVWSLTGYDSSNTLLGGGSIPALHGDNTGSYFGLSSSGPAFASATLQVDLSQLSTSLPDYVFIDNFATSAGASSAPEPGTWALMLVGFGAVGFGLRRRAAALAA